MSYSGNSNAPWQRNLGQIFHSGPQQFVAMQQQGISFGGHGIFPAGSGGNAVSYPTRTGLNPVAFQQPAPTGGQSQHYNSIGTVTKINNDCGLVNDEVFFYRNVCKGHAPKLGDRVLFEASYSSSGQFKWNATRIQLMPQQSHQLISGSGGGGKGSGYNAVPPPGEYRGGRGPQRKDSSPRRGSPAGRGDRHGGGGRIERRERDRTHEIEGDRKRRREDTDRSRERVSVTGRAGGAGSNNTARDRSVERKDRERNDRRERERRERDKNDKDRTVVERSPHRPAAVKGRRPRIIRRYMVEIPKSILSYYQADIQDIRQRFSTLYIPSDFFHANIKWSETFTPDNAFSLHRPCQFHIMHKIVENPFEEQKADQTEPADADYLYSAKVMLLACPPVAELYSKCCDDDDTENEQHTVHPSRLISFLVGTRGRNEPMAIGGPWSPSLDGENPDKDPAVLIRTAIRTCKALTGIDLSNCTQWYRFVELYYHRSDYKHHSSKEKTASPRIETVVIYLPDVHSCMPSIAEWQTLSQAYKGAVENVIARRAAAVAVAAASAKTSASTSGEEKATLADSDLNAEADGDAEADGGDGEGETALDGEAEAVEGEVEDAAEEVLEETSATAEDEAEAADADNADEANTTAGSTLDLTAEGDDIENEKDDSPEPTHYSKLDLKNMKVQEIRNELIARNLPSKGVRHLVMARLAKALNTEKAEDIAAKKQRNFEAKAERIAAAAASEKMQVDDESPKKKIAKTTKTTATEQKKKEEQAQKKTTAAASKESKDSEEKKDKAADEDQEEDHVDWGDVDMSDIVILDEYDSSKNPEESPKEMDEKEKNQLMRRYTLPSAPHIVVHPNKTYKGGKFDCSVMSLSVLLDYREEDTKERFFEVSYFAELFNEMLMRDFGFNIYKELYYYKPTNVNNDATAADDATKNGEESKKDESDVKEDEEKVKENGNEKQANAETTDKPSEKSSEKSGEKSGRERRVSKRTSNDEPSQEEDSQSVKSSADRKRKTTTSSSKDAKDKEREKEKKEKEKEEDKKMVVVKPHLLLSFIYFDTSHCGYIFEKDLENLFSILGLNLSRGQIRKVLGNVASRQAFYYRKLTHKEETPEATPTIEDFDLPPEELKRIALGNRQFESIFGGEDQGHANLGTIGNLDGESDGGLVNYHGAVVHVGKLVDQIKRTEKNYSELEKLHNDLRKQHADLQKDHTKSSGKIKDLQSELKSVNRKLSDADQSLFSLNRKYKDQHSTLSYIYNRVAPYFAREKDKDHKSESSRDKGKDKDGKDDKESKDKDNKDKSKSKEHAAKDDDTKSKKSDDKEKSSKVIENDMEADENIDDKPVEHAGTEMKKTEEYEEEDDDVEEVVDEVDEVVEIPEDEE